jgi:hypothetical protein
VAGVIVNTVVLYLLVGCGLGGNYGMDVSFTWALLPVRTAQD